MAWIVHELFGRPFGWSFESILTDLNINERTLQRYLNKFKRSFVDSAGKPLVEVFMRGDRRVLRLAQHPQSPNSNAYKAASLFFTLTVLHFLDGTILKEGVDDLWDRLREQLPQAQGELLSDVERKFFAVPSAPKNYKDFDEQLDFILRALLHGWRLEIEYRALAEPRTHQFDPYTLIAYKGGLYLAGRSNLSDQVLYLAVERMRHVGFIERDARNERFSMPASWRPERHTEGAFGIVDGSRNRSRAAGLQRRNRNVFTLTGDTSNAEVSPSAQRQDHSHYEGPWYDGAQKLDSRVRAMATGV